MKANFETGLKICSKYQKELSLDNFCKSKSNTDGYNYCCKTCHRDYCKVHSKTEARKESDRKFYQRKKGVLQEQRLKDKEKKALYDKRHYGENRDRLLLNSKENYKKPEVKKQRYKRFKQRKIEDINFRLTFQLRLSILHRMEKCCGTFELLGCTIEEFKTHIESQFTEGMTWKNHGRKGWHLDHIIPCAYFDQTVLEQQKICWNWRNFQPLWSMDNHKKAASVPENVEQLVEQLKKEIYDNN